MKPVQVFLRFEKLFKLADSMPGLVPPFRVAASFSSALSSSITSLSLEVRSLLDDNDRRGSRHAWATRRAVIG